MPEEKKEGLLGKLESKVHHKKTEGGEPATTSPTTEQSTSDQPKKESEMDKFKDYMAEDKRLESEGKEYGGLM